MAGTQPNHFVTGRKDSVKTVASNKPTKEEMRASYEKAKKEGKVKSGEIITPAKAGKVVTEVAKKLSKVASKVDEIAKNSVKVKPANKSQPSNETLNSSTNVTLKAMKSGNIAKQQAKLEEKRNQISNQFFGKSPTVKIKSGDAKPYKTTDDVGSTARRAAEKAKKVKGD
jgi:hypothetical protein